MKIIIVVRSNADWKNMNMESFFQQNTHFINDKNRDRYANYIQTWNDKFNLSFFEFRHRIKLLSEYTWGNMESVQAIIKDLDYAEAIIENTDDCLVLPTDDDDWYHPKLVSALRNRKADHAKWKMATHNAAKMKVAISKPFYGTNSFAFFKRGWDKLVPNKKKNTMRRHSLAAGALKPTKCALIPRCLSCWNRTLASLTMGQNEEESLRLMRRRAINATKKKTIPEEANWIKPYAKRLIQLYKDML